MHGKQHFQFIFIYCSWWRRILLVLKGDNSYTIPPLTGQQEFGILPCWVCCCFSASFLFSVATAAASSARRCFNCLSSFSSLHFLFLVFSTEWWATWIQYFNSEFNAYFETCITFHKYHFVNINNMSTDSL